MAIRHPAQPRQLRQHLPTLYVGASASTLLCPTIEPLLVPPCFLALWSALFARPKRMPIPPLLSPFSLHRRYPCPIYRNIISNVSNPAYKTLDTFSALRSCDICRGERSRSRGAYSSKDSGTAGHTNGLSISTIIFLIALGLYHFRGFGLFSPGLSCRTFCCWM